MQDVRSIAIGRYPVHALENSPGSSLIVPEVVCFPGFPVPDILLCYYDDLCDNLVLGQRCRSAYSSFNNSPTQQTLESLCDCSNRGCSQLVRTTIHALRETSGKELPIKDKHESTVFISLHGLPFHRKTWQSVHDNVASKNAVSRP
jgi:hypothetical protein